MAWGRDVLAGCPSLSRDPPRADGRQRYRSVPRAGHEARGTRHAAVWPRSLEFSQGPARRRASAPELGAAGSGGPSMALPGLSRSCCHLSTGCSWSQSPSSPRGPSEHGHPQLCSARGCGSHKLCRASVGAMGLGTRAGLGAGPPLGGCSVPSTPDCRGRETRGWFPVGVHPHCGGSAPGKGAGWEVREEKPQPLPSPLLPGLPTAGRGGRDPRHGGVPAAQLAFKNAISHGCAINYQASVQRGVRHEGAFVSV